MSFNYDRYRRDRRQSSNRTTSPLSYWVPLVLTLTVATAGVAAWVWSERRDDEEESDDADLSYGEETRGVDDSIVSRVIRRTPSPQQLFDTVSKKTAAGWAAAGAALTSIREEDRDDFGDHSRWAEEAGASQSRSVAEPVRKARAYTGKRKTVVLVVSAESLMDLHDDDASYRSENATILAHLPDTDFARTKLFVLIYSPSLRSPPQSRAGRSMSSLGDSYSAVSMPLTPHDERDETVYTPALSARSSDSHLYTTLHTQAMRLVEDAAMVMPFSTTSGFVHMLRHIGPELCYVVDALSGVNGQNVEDLRRWVGQVVVVVGTDGTGLGGLVDTDDEDMKGKGEHQVILRWWEVSPMIGLGKGVEVVDASRLEDDYERRVGGKE